MMFDEQYGQLSVNTLPGHYGYGDSDGGELQGATLMSQGAVNPKGLLHEQPASTEMGGLLDKIKSSTSGTSTKATRSSSSVALLAPPDLRPMRQALRHTRSWLKRQQSRPLQEATPILPVPLLSGRELAPSSIP
jgi:hypothetical protein